jgi:hypothetical protein
MKRMVALLAVLFALAIPASALGSSCQTYNPQLCGVSDASGSSGTLPFTGINVGLLALGGVTLLCAGLAVRRVARNIN